MPVPVTGIVAKCTMNTANPMGSGANTFIFQDQINKLEFMSSNTKTEFSHFILVFERQLTLIINLKKYVT